MAHLVAEIALTRPDLLSLRRSTSKATADLRARALTGKIEFLTEIADSSTPLLIDLSSATIANDPLVLLSWLPALRKFAELKPVVALLNKQLCKDIGPSLPLGVSATTVGEFRTRRRWKKVNVVDVLGKGQPGGYGCREADVVFHDQRWSSSRRDQIKSVLGDAPLILPGVLWEPSALFVRKAHGGLTNLGTNRPKYSVFWDSSAHSRSSGSRSNSHYLFYNVQDWAEAQRGVLSLIEAPPHHVVWAAMTGNGVQKAVMACCALQGHRYQGAVDVQFHNDGSTGLPAPRDLDGRFRNCAEITISAMNSHL
jgi:hypothetical protein